MLISNFPSNPDLSPFGYPGYALFTSFLVIPIFVLPMYFPSIETFTSLIPESCNAHPATCNSPFDIDWFTFGKSKLLLASKVSFPITIALSIVCIELSLAMI